MKTPEEIIIWCDMMLDRHPNIEDTNFFNSIKDYMKEQRPKSNIISMDGCPTDQTTYYHLSCPQCGKTWWGNDAFSIRCPECGIKR